MQAIILATGESHKLRPLTVTLPSPLLPVANRPVMGYGIELLARHGVKQITVSLHHLAGEIERFFGDGRRWGVSLHYRLQREVMGTAGSLLLAKQALTETFIVLPGDIVADVDLTAALAAHQASTSVATIITRPLQASGAGVDQNNHTLNHTANHTGIYIFEPEVMAAIPYRTPFDIQEQLIPHLLSTGATVHKYEAEGYYNPLNTWADYQAAQKYLLHNERTTETSGRARFVSLTGLEVQRGVWLGRKSSVHPQANLVPPVYIGEQCQIGKGVELGPYAVLGNHVIVDENATIANSTILNDTYVGQLLHLQNKVVAGKLVIDTASANHVHLTDPFLLNEIGRTLHLTIQRGLDILIALLWLLLLSPLLLLVAALLIVTTGQVFERVVRYSRKTAASGDERDQTQQVHHLLHFRTRAADGQLSRLGYWLARWELNRLPELFAVLWGELRFVGVKPLTEAEMKEANEPWHQTRTGCEPGFTGLWYTQTQGSELDEILMADVYYAATHTWGGDIRLVCHTPVRWCKRLIEEGKGHEPTALTKPTKPTTTFS